MNTTKLKSDPIKTVLVITLGMLIIYIATDWKWALNTSLTIGLLGFISPLLAKKIDLIWLKLTWLLSLVVPNILLSVIFYIFLTPLAILSRLIGNKNQLTLKNKEISMFKDNKKKFDPVSFEKPW